MSEKSRFLAAASHDLRQPLQTISFLQGMLEKRVSDDATLKLVHRIDETVRTMSSMLDKLLDINQLEAGIVRPVIIEFPILRLLEEMRTEFTYHTATNGLDWRVVPSSLVVRSDPRLLEQIIRNLLSNAVKYTTRGKVLLGCRRGGDKLRIEVWDTGPGIPNWSFRRSLKNFISLTIPQGNEAKALVSVLLSSSALLTCSGTRSMFALVWVRAPSSVSKYRVDEPM
jgi:two-component system, chemotaxis family, CheB/CheR fusion protein